MEKIIFTDEETKEEVGLYIIEETTLSQRHFLLVQEELTDDAECYVFEEIGGDGEDSVYEPVEDDELLATLSDVFQAILDEEDEEA